ncbi:hydroxyproline-rich glycoprotein family protein [Parasponia andersonii]|uniref:Hydroxyproline-rich glycoprotein family protein n=1 Tax=Parasponia andersonii TaxID=3476 RepID=A0A2P5D9P4_PARAD|nr:hydroxyproline-rich glycoprotein family protein [Parasponia andersonii]
MAEIELRQTSRKKPVRQPPSVPFLWEVKPGIPKKDWKPEVHYVSSVPTPPVKLIASVPFHWEEKPGTPLPSFSQPPQEPVTALLPLPPIHDYLHKDVDADKHIEDDGSGNDGDGDDEDSLFKMDLETFGSETDDSYSSAPSLLANCLVSSVAISAAVPAHNTSLTEDNNGDLLESLSSPASETESSTSSYATGNSSPVGASFLECLFPLFPPNSGFLGKVGHSESVTPQEARNQKCDYESNDNLTVRRPPTLGELIMMSRRRSYRRKAVQMRKQNLSMQVDRRTGHEEEAIATTETGMVKTKLCLRKVLNHFGKGRPPLSLYF